MSVRVRFAPSPTGLQHIGSVRTALFNYLFARSQGGTFILRIEDTDRERTVDEALDDIYDTYEWLGFHWDEGPDVGGPMGPYIQSERREIYPKYAEELLSRGAAYRCYCTPERLENLRNEQAQTKGPQGYDRHCRQLSDDQKKKAEAENASFVVRAKIPLEGETSFHDEILGDIKRKNIDINPDPVLIKSDGFPTYHFANVVDDHLMQISHILRAQEWIPSVPIYVHLYAAFGWEPPLYYHLPFIVGKDGKKLGKRHGSTSVQEFRKQGYLPDAMVNFLSLLGWSYDDAREFFELTELEKLFDGNKFNKSPAVFDYKKIAWFNGMYIRKKSLGELKELIRPYLVDAGTIPAETDDEIEQLLDGGVALIQERLRLLVDSPQLLHFLFHEVEKPEASDLIPKKQNQEMALAALENMAELLPTIVTDSEEASEASVRDLAETLDVKLGDLLMPLRVAITGSSVSPPLFASIKLLGPEKAQKRIGQAVQALSSP